MKAFVFKGLPFGKCGICEIFRDENMNLEHSIYVKIPPEISPYKDQDYWQVMAVNFKIVQDNAPLWIEGE